MKEAVVHKSLESVVVMSALHEYLFIQAIRISEYICSAMSEFVHGSLSSPRSPLALQSFLFFFTNVKKLRNMPFFFFFCFLSSKKLKIPTHVLCNMKQFLSRDGFANKGSDCERFVLGLRDT